MPGISHYQVELSEARARDVTSRCDAIMFKATVLPGRPHKAIVSAAPVDSIIFRDRDGSGRLLRAR
jgi:hypothetical protein